MLRKEHQLFDLPQEKLKPGDPSSLKYDLMAIQLAHFDAIVIKTNIGGTDSKRLLMENERSHDMLFLKAFTRMEIDPKNLNTCSGRLGVITGHENPITK